ncbi:protein of unknown function [Paraburkholderia kururiensis]
MRAEQMAHGQDDERGKADERHGRRNRAVGEPPGWPARWRVRQAGERSGDSDEALIVETCRGAASKARCLLAAFRCRNRQARALECGTIRRDLPRAACRLDATVSSRSPCAYC